MKQTKFWLGIFSLGVVLTFSQCGDDDEGPAGVTIESIEATGTDLTSGSETTVDLNGASAGTDVPPDATISVTFSREIDATTASSANLTLNDGSSDAAVSLSTSGATVTITPSEELARGTDYTLSISGSVAATDGGAFIATSRTFTTAGRAEVTPPNSSNQVAYWRFDGDATDEMGSYNADTEIAIEYQEDRFGQIMSTAYFDGDASIIEVPEAASLMDDANSFTVSFWVKTNTEGHVNENDDPTGMFVFGLGGANGIQYEIFGSYDGSKFAISYTNEDGEEYGEDMWFPNGATDNTNGGWQGWDFAKNLTAEQMMDIIKDTWYQAIFTYDAEEKRSALYFNGELMKSFDFDLWPDGDVKQSTVGVDYRGTKPDVVDDLAFGFIHSREGTLFDGETWGNYDVTTSNHFKGWLDDFRVFDAAFSAEEAAALYEAEN